ncbi:uncharacterized protein BJ171DRAFT_112490 [Polychytrium aggregatum]|uniref:uncharacterized protein n=1 Tax=Polychytrium aggregatum TaxID=110093 RepID=UPI0022FF423C|nr:uncharacterized protein BJ171DRAFT_112490 [Polychytrium aggregatum]KAI9209285.1 hypothetical protein BJ171DRAFT_112490 [Polychytrium aggregatum]
MPPAMSKTPEPRAASNAEGDEDQLSIDTVSTMANLTLGFQKILMSQLEYSASLQSRLQESERVLGDLAMARERKRQKDRRQGHVDTDDDSDRDDDFSDDDDVLAQDHGQKNLKVLFKNIQAGLTKVSHAQSEITRKAAQVFEQKRLAEEAKDHAALGESACPFKPLLDHQKKAGVPVDASACPYMSQHAKKAEAQTVSDAGQCPFRRSQDTEQAKPVGKVAVGQEDAPSATGETDKAPGSRCPYLAAAKQNNTPVDALRATECPHMAGLLSQAPKDALN